MIERSQLNREKMKQSGFIPKPSANPFRFYDNPNPEGMGLHQLQKGKAKKKKKK
jgi:hypothetical protein